jgi:type III secretion protein L
MHGDIERYGSSMVFILPRSALSAQDKLPAISNEIRVLKGEDHVALVDAQTAVLHAKNQANRIIADAQEAFEAEKKRGYTEGRDAALLDQAEKMIETVGRTVDYFSGVEGKMVDLVMQAVRKVIDGFDNKEQIVIVVKNALAVVRNQKQMTLRLHPDEVDIVRERINELLAAYPGVGYLDIMADARLTLGACILESDIGMVEASLEGQITALHNAFQRTFGSRV